MELVSPVTFVEVRAAYASDHPAEREHAYNTNLDGEKVLEMADQRFGTWARVRLSRSDVLGVTLPWHLSESGGRELVPRSGLTVGQAARRIRSAGAVMANENPVCTHKLDLMGRAPFTPLYLSVRPVPHSDYADLRVRDGLIHLDGLHRMIGWELAGRLPRAHRIEAFLAGDPTSGP